MAEMVSQAGPERVLAANRAGGNARTRPHQRAAPGQIPPAHKELPILLKGVQPIGSRASSDPPQTLEHHQGEAAALLWQESSSG